MLLNASIISFNIEKQMKNRNFIIYAALTLLIGFFLTVYAYSQPSPGGNEPQNHPNVKLTSKNAPYVNEKQNQQNVNPSSNNASNATFDGEFQKQQNKTFSWQPVSNAVKYQVDIQKLSEDGKWQRYIANQTEECEKEILLEPGEYRVAISAFNIIGRRSSTTTWTKFTVKADVEPFISDDYLNKSNKWNSPVLYIKQISENADVESIEKNIQLKNANSGFPDNSFALNAKNVFSEETQFTLVPVSKSSSGGVPYDVVNIDRKISSLSVAKRDEENNKIILSYNPNELYSGYYNIDVKNSDGLSTSLCILVLVDRTPVIEKNSYDYDENYKTYTVTFDKEKENVLTVTGYNFTDETTFVLTPSTEGIPYPFASALERKEIPLNVSNREELDGNGRIKLDFKVDVNYAKTGYYKIQAENKNTGTDNVLLLVKIKDDDNLSKPKISSVKSSVQGNSITFTIKGQNLLGASFFLISAVSDVTGLNEKIPLTLLDTKWGGAKLILDADAEKFAKGSYAIMAEKNNAFSIQYVEMDKQLHTSLDKKVAAEESNETYLRPTDFVEPVKQEEDEQASVEEDSRVVEVTGKNKYFMPFLFFDIDLKNIESSADNISVSGMFDIFDTGWFALKFGGSLQILKNESSIISSADFTFPFMKYFLPYAGAGISVNYSDLDIAELEVPFYMGVVVFEFLDFKYTCVLNNVLFSSNNMYFLDSFSIGCRFPLRQKTYTKKTNGFDSKITKQGSVSGTEVSFHKDETFNLVFDNGVTEISNFDNMKSLESVTLPDTLEALGKNAFYKCKNLHSIVLPNNLTRIGENAFAECSYLYDLTIPYSVVEISSNAFSGSGLDYIRLDWTSSDETERDLSGLKHFDGKVFYKDNALFHYKDYLENKR